MHLMERADPDRETAARAAAGDGPAFRALVESWSGRVLAFASRMVRDRALAEDLAQEVFLHLYQVLRRYDPERPFAPWMRRVTANVILNRLRSRPPAARSLDAGEGEGAVPADPRSPDPGREAERAEEASALRRLLEELPAGWRAVVALRYTEGLDLREIALALDIPENTVKTRLFRAREALRVALRPADGGRVP
jgi:RNA polymerase sigma-70 factor (ECF subfamily)